jgi:hypothetical protein
MRTGAEIGADVPGIPAATRGAVAYSEYIGGQGGQGLGTSFAPGFIDV